MFLKNQQNHLFQMYLKMLKNQPNQINLIVQQNQPFQKFLKKPKNLLNH
jgi:hypothetical protein